MQHPRQLRGSRGQLQQSLEQAENKTLLVNILRAANERPLYFTNFSAIRGSMSAAVGTGAEGSIGWESGNSTSLGAALTPSFTIENSPSFDLAVQDTQAFARGVLTPIDNNVLDVFYQQDRDMERLLDLFVSRIDLFVKPRKGSRAEDDYLASFWNDPFFKRRATDAQVTKGVKPQEYGRAGFRCVRTALVDAGLELRQAESLEPTDLTLPVGQLGDAEAIASALKDGIRFVPGTSAGSVELFRIAGDREFAFAGTPKTQPSAAPASKSAPDDRAGNQRPPRAQDVQDSNPRQLSRFQQNELLVTPQIPAPGSSTVEVEVNGRRYAVPKLRRDDACILSQLKQLIALHNNADAAPQTAAVTVVGTGRLRAGR